MGEDDIEVMVADLPRLRGSGCLLPFGSPIGLLFPPPAPPRHAMTMSRVELLDRFLRSVGFLAQSWWEDAQPPTWDPSSARISFSEELRGYSFRPQDLPFNQALDIARERGIRLVRVMAVGDDDVKNTTYVVQERARRDVETAYEPLGTVSIDGEEWLGPDRAPEAVLVYYSKTDLEAT